LTKCFGASGNNRRPPRLMGKEPEMSDKVHFQTNIPVEVALKYGDGKDVNGQYGDQVLYTLSPDAKTTLQLRFDGVIPLWQRLVALKSQ
jgi:hypothetical protein